MDRVRPEREEEEERVGEESREWAGVSDSSSTSDGVSSNSSVVLRPPRSTQLVPLRTRAEQKRFMRAILTRFVDVADMGFVDALRGAGVLNDRDAVSLNGSHLPTDLEKNRRLWSILCDIDHEKFVNKVLPPLCQRYWYIIPERFWLPGNARRRLNASGELEGGANSGSRSCARCAIRRRIRPPDLGDFLMKAGLITLKTYNDINDGYRKSSTDWSKIFAAFKRLDGHDVTSHVAKIRKMMARHSLQLPDNLSELIVKGFPCTCSSRKKHGLCLPKLACLSPASSTESSLPSVHSLPVSSDSEPFGYSSSSSLLSSSSHGAGDSSLAQNNSDPSLSQRLSDSEETTLKQVVSVSALNNSSSTEMIVGCASPDENANEANDEQTAVKHTVGCSQSQEESPTASDDDESTMIQKVGHVQPEEENGSITSEEEIRANKIARYIQPKQSNPFSREEEAEVLPSAGHSHSQQECPFQDERETGMQQIEENIQSNEEGSFTAEMETRVKQTEGYFQPSVNGSFMNEEEETRLKQTARNRQPKEEGSFAHGETTTPMDIAGCTKSQEQISRGSKDETEKEQTGEYIQPSQNGSSMDEEKMRLTKTPGSTRSKDENSFACKGETRVTPSETKQSGGHDFSNEIGSFMGEEKKGSFMGEEITVTSEERARVKTGNDHGRVEDPPSSAGQLGENTQAPCSPEETVYYKIDETQMAVKRNWVYSMIEAQEKQRICAETQRKEGQSSHVTEANANNKISNNGTSPVQAELPRSPAQTSISTTPKTHVTYIATTAVKESEQSPNISLRNLSYPKGESQDRCAVRGTSITIHNDVFENGNEPNNVLSAAPSSVGLCAYISLCGHRLRLCVRPSRSASCLNNVCTGMCPARTSRQFLGICQCLPGYQSCLKAAVGVVWLILFLFLLLTVASAPYVLIVMGLFTENKRLIPAGICVHYIYLLVAFCHRNGINLRRTSPLGFFLSFIFFSLGWYIPFLLYKSQISW